LQFSATLINLTQNGQIFYDNQAHKVNLPKMGKCFTTIVGQSDWFRHCYWLSCLTQSGIKAQLALRHILMRGLKMRIF